MNKLNKRLGELDDSLKALLEELKVFSDETLNDRPDEETWSVLQVMQHLKVSENLSMKYVQKKLSFKPKLKRAFLLSPMRLQLLKLYLNSPLKYKAPKVVDTPSFPPDSTFWEVAKQWSQQRQELAEFLQSLPPEMFKKAIYKHPIAGRLSLYGMLDFFQLHFNRHRKQITALLDL